MRIAAGVGVGVWVARYLDPSGFGRLNYVISFVGLLMPLVSLGLDQLVVREIVKDEKSSDLIIATALKMKLVAAFIVIVLINSFIWSGNSDLAYKLLFLFVSLHFLFKAFNVYEFWAQARLSGRQFSLASLSGILTSAGYKILLIISGSSLVWFGLGLAIELLVTGLILIVYYYYKTQRNPFKGFSYSVALKLLKDSWPLILSAIAIGIYMRIDQVMINNMLNAKETGYYSAVVKLTEAFYMIPVVLAVAVLPSIVKTREDRPKLYYHRMRLFFSLLLYMSLFLAMSMYLFSEEIISFLYGVDYIASTEILNWQIWAIVFVFLGVATGNFILSENLQKYSSYLTIMGAILNIFLNYFLIPVYGSIGAAVATVISQAFASSLGYVLFYNTRNFFFKHLEAIYYPITFLYRRLLY